MPGKALVLVGSNVALASSQAEEAGRFVRSNRSSGSEEYQDTMLGGRQDHLPAPVVLHWLPS
jgi:hypothetical protein